MRAIGVVEAIDERRRLAAVELRAGGHAVIELREGVLPDEGDVLSGFLDTFGDEALENLTKRRAVRANVRFLGCSRAVALEIIRAR